MSYSIRSLEEEFKVIVPIYCGRLLIGITGFVASCAAADITATTMLPSESLQLKSRKMSFDLQSVFASGKQADEGGSFLFFDAMVDELAAGTNGFHGFDFDHAENEKTPTTSESTAIEVLQIEFVWGDFLSNPLSILLDRGSLIRWSDHEDLRLERPAGEYPDTRHLFEPLPFSGMNTLDFQ